MARAIVSPTRLASASAARLFGFLAILMLAGCVGDTTYDDLNNLEPIGSPYSVALFKNYSYLARSFGSENAPQAQAFDADGSISLTGDENTIPSIASVYAQKALAAGKGDDEVMPEIAPEGDVRAENLRIQLLHDLEDGRDKAPEDAARAQADYDCWVLNRRVPALAKASQTCERSFTQSLAKLDREVQSSSDTDISDASASGAAPDNASSSANGAAADTSQATTAPSAPTPPPVQTATATQATPAPGTFTVLFAAKSAKLAIDQMAVVNQAITAARNGRQTHITVVGHCDNAENSKRLALKRAEAVKAAMVALGARSEAVSATGVGKDEAIAQTADAAGQAQNRAAVITLVP